MGRGMQIYGHNLEAYSKVKTAFSEGRHAAIVMPTGSGKSYVAYQLIEDSMDKRILYATAYRENLDQFRKLIGGNPGPCSGGIEFQIYKGLDPNGKYDVIILDEIHRCGAPAWNRSVLGLLANNPDAKILGMSATPIRYLDGMRNMASELFAGNVVYELSPGDAMGLGILPIPHYYGGVYSFQGELDKASRALGKSKAAESEKQASKELLDRARRQIENSNGAGGVLLRNLYRDGKYLAFCKDYRHLAEMREKCASWLRAVPHEFFTCYSMDRSCRDAYREFCGSKGRLSICFCIDMLNEGVHPEIDGGIFFRPTDSMNVYIQQSGRVLSTGERNRPVQVFDFVNNYGLLSEARSYWMDIASSLGKYGKAGELRFSVSQEDVDIKAMLDEFYVSLSISQEEWVDIFKEYHAEHGSLSSITKSTEYRGHRIGRQARHFRGMHASGSLDARTESALQEMGFVWDPRGAEWDEAMEKAKRFCAATGKPLSDVKSRDKYDGWGIGDWVGALRVARRNQSSMLTQERIGALDSLGMSWGNQKDEKWDMMLSLVNEFIENESVGVNDITKDTLYKGEEIGVWLKRQRELNASGHLATGRKKELLKLGFAESKKDFMWEKSFAAYKAYIEENGLDINGIRFRDRTEDGRPIGSWLGQQMQAFREGKLPKNRENKLRSIGFGFVPADERFWQKNYKAAENLSRRADLNKVPYRHEEDGLRIGAWLSSQRQKYRDGQLDDEKAGKLKKIGVAL